MNDLLVLSRCCRIADRRSGVRAAASRNQFFQGLCHAPELSREYSAQAETAGGSVDAASLGLSGMYGASYLPYVRSLKGCLRQAAARTPLRPHPYQLLVELRQEARVPYV